MKRIHAYSGPFDLGRFTDALVIIGDWHRARGEQAGSLYEWLNGMSTLAGEVWSIYERWEVEP